MSKHGHAAKKTAFVTERGTGIALRVTKETELDSSSVLTSRKHKIVQGQHCLRAEDSGLTTAQPQLCQSKPGSVRLLTTDSILAILGL